MCLTVPGIVLSVEDGDPAFRNAEVDFCGVKKTVNLAYTPEVIPGDFVLVHVGFAISRVDRDEAEQIYQGLRSIGALDASNQGFPHA
ncbi:MAG: HypC/HybG/HupF family hydrogenase formation chaperone [Bryobacteraceae bacterium]